MQYKAVIFDLDGTLLDTLADIAESGNQALAACGLPSYPVDRYRDWVGQGLRRLCEQVIPPGQFFARGRRGGGSASTCWDGRRMHSRSL